MYSIHDKNGVVETGFGSMDEALFNMDCLVSYWKNPGHDGDVDFDVDTLFIVKKD